MKTRYTTMTVQKKVASVFALLSLWAVVATVLLGTEKAIAVQGQAVSELSGQQIRQLIEQLSSDKFAEREQATRRLMDAGEQVVPVLEKVAKSSSVEVRIRAERILAGRRVDGESPMSESDQTLVEQFRSASPRGRLLMLRTYATSNKPKLFLKLVEMDLDFSDKTQGQLPPAIDTFMATNSAVFANLLSSAMARNDWEAVEYIVEHPVTLRLTPMIRALAAHGRGEFQGYIDKTFDRLREQHRKGLDVVERDLVSLIGLLRLQEDFKRAGQAVSWLPDQAMRDLIRLKIVFQRGQWAEVLRRTRLGQADAQRISVNDTQTALLQYLAGDANALAKTIDTMRADLNSAAALLSKKEGDQEKGNGSEKGIKAISVEAANVQRLKGNLRLIGIVTLDWDLTQEFLDPSEPEENAEFLASLNRTDGAMELLGAGDAFESREARMKQVLGELQEVQGGLLKRSASRRNEAYTRLKAEEKRLTTIALLIAEWAENHGLDDEAQLYFQMIFAADRSNVRTQQQNVLVKLLELERTADYWRVAEAMMRGPDKQKFVGRVTYGVSSLTAKSLARQWALGIRGSFQDPVLEAKTVAAVANSPWVDAGEIDFDLEYEIARYRTNSRLTTDGNVEYSLSQVYELHGDDQASQQLLKQSVDLGNTRAMAMQFRHAVANEDYRAILDSWFDSYRGYRSVSGGLIAGHAAEALLDSKELDATEEVDVRRQLYRSQVAVMSVWHGNSPWLSSGMRELAALGAEHLSIFPLKAIVFGVNGDVRSAQQMELALVSALASKKSEQKTEATAMLAAVFFESLAFDSVNAKSSRGWVSDSLMLHLAWAKGLLEQGEYDRATDVLVRVAKFNLGDVSAGEDAIGLLQQAGAKTQADRLYQAIASHYFKTLQKYPDSPLARNNLAWLSVCANRDLDAARRHAEIAVAARPNTVQYLDTLAAIEFLQGNVELAFELCKRCVQLFPGRFYYRQQKKKFFEAMKKSAGR